MDTQCIIISYLRDLKLKSIVPDPKSMQYALFDCFGVRYNNFSISGKLINHGCKIALSFI